MPKSQNMQQTIGNKGDSARGAGGGADAFGKTVVSAMNATINSALMRGDMQGGSGIDSRTLKFMQDML